MSTLFSFIFTLVLGNQPPTEEQPIGHQSPVEEQHVGHRHTHDVLSPEATALRYAPIEPLQEEQPADVHVVVISDLNGPYGSVAYSERVHRAVQKIVDRKPDLVLITGDMVAGQKKDLPYREMWKAFHQAVTTPLQNAAIPVMVTPGNHDASFFVKFAEERSIFADEWMQRKPAVNYIDDSHYPFRYAFMVENTLFVSLDDTRPGGLGAEQEKWLDNVLDTKADNKVVFGHLPLYPFVQKKAREVIGDPKIETMLNDHKVNLFVSGHHHAYYPGQRGKLQMLAAPCLGAGSRQLINADKRSEKGFVEFYIRDGVIEELEAWTGERFSRVIDRRTLPFYVGTEEFQIWRDDLILEHHN